MMKVHKDERKRKSEIQVNVLYDFCRYGSFYRHQGSRHGEIRIPRQTSHFSPFGPDDWPDSNKSPASCFSWPSYSWSGNARTIAPHLVRPRVPIYPARMLSPRPLPFASHAPSSPSTLPSARPLTRTQGANVSHWLILCLIYELVTAMYIQLARSDVGLVSHHKEK